MVRAVRVLLPLHRPAELRATSQCMRTRAVCYRDLSARVAWRRTFMAGSCYCYAMLCYAVLCCAGHSGDRRWLFARTAPRGASVEMRNLGMAAAKGNGGRSCALAGWRVRGEMSRTVVRLLGGSVVVGECWRRGCLGSPTAAKARCRRCLEITESSTWARNEQALRATPLQQQGRETLVAALGNPEFWAVLWLCKGGANGRMGVIRCSTAWRHPAAAGLCRYRPWRSPRDSVDARRFL